MNIVNVSVQCNDGAVLNSEIFSRQLGPQLVDDFGRINFVHFSMFDQMHCTLQTIIYILFISSL